MPRARRATAAAARSSAASKRRAQRFRRRARRRNSLRSASASKSASASRDAALGGQRARLPVAPRGFLPLRLRHRVDCREHVAPRQARSAARTRHACSSGGKRRVAGLAEPLVGRRVELARRVIGEPRVAVLALRFRQLVAPLDPRRARGGGVAARGALERVQRELAPRSRVPGEAPLRQRALGIAVGVARIRAR